MSSQRDSLARGHFGTFSRFVRSEASEKTRLLTALPCLASGPWPLMDSTSRCCVHCNLIIYATVLRALLMYNSVADNFLTTTSDYLLLRRFDFSRKAEAGELEARETGNEHARDHGKEKGERRNACDNSVDFSAILSFS